jgi:polyhydroxyalkanoate synthesis regulator phasin
MSYETKQMLNNIQDEIDDINESGALLFAGITTLTTAINTENVRATTAEGANTTAINTENTRATTAEGVNTTAINTENIRAVAAEGVNTTAINTENVRAVAAEGANTTAINTENVRAVAAEGANTTAINTENVRATTAEALVQSNLNTENVRATAAEGVNTTAINTENVRATTAEALLQTNLNTANITYAFHVTSSINTNQLMTGGSIAIFNAIELCTPIGTFNTSTYKYICPIAGIYTFGFKAFINTVSTNFRLGIYKNGGLIAMGGAGSEATESFDCIAQCSINDAITIQCITGSVHIFMGVAHSFFYGHRIGN